ncbi:sugar-binding transcriptional regulator [Puniceibacterium sp. IMCC21224]|uniref:sugar-binding transcriptional regulator n=1 Tax=Puniceibacterium sp. IMCC21224 TaxID=1618204 RepID=UPI00065D4B53|nr:sugar-binding transcriptional regulator [Puniceibacterium sp. IMCC21224]KMK66217.1 transcriptional regulator with sigma factor-related N-terminal domain [Puniceibacterium sp. IMCC21224]
MTLGRIIPESARLDDAARAGWLYYVAGNTQDEIARKLGVSRQSAQRLVSLAMSERLVKVRIDHPIAACMDLARALTDRFGLRHCDVVPSDPAAPDLLTGVAIAAATELERRLKQSEELIIALGTGRALKACVEQLPRMDCPQHRIVSLLGNIMADGSATPYNATIRMADRVGAQHYPYPLPVLARDARELELLQGQEAVRHTLELCARADLTLVGIGQMGRTAPLYVDGFISDDEMAENEAAGAMGEITSWIYDGRGRMIDTAFSSRVASAPLPSASGRDVIAVAVGAVKTPAILAALTGNLINGLITNEATASLLLV